MAVVVKSAVAEVAKSADIRVSSETYDALDNKVTEILSKAIERAKANGRKTLMAQDL